MDTKPSVSALAQVPRRHHEEVPESDFAARGGAPSPTE